MDINPTALTHGGTVVIDPNRGHPRDAASSAPTNKDAAPKGFFARLSGGVTRRLLAPGPGPEPASLTYEVGIRPSFYWLDADLSPAERKQQEEMARSLKSDCQDQAVVVENFGGRRGALFAGVFDGHGPDGRACATFVGSMLPKLLGKDSKLWSDDERRCYKAFKSACYHTNDSLSKPAQSKVNATLSGTTACFAVVADGTISVGSVGDSRCIVVRRAADGAVRCEQLSWDAKPELSEERKRIRTKGGVVAQLHDPAGQPVGAYRVFRRPGDLLPGLAMSRSLGDSLAHSLGVVAKPVFRSYHVQPDDLCVVLGTDGVFDVMDNERVGRCVCEYLDRRDPVLSAADMLTMEAQELWKTMGDDIIVDDVAAVVVYLQPLPEARLPPKPLDKTVVKAAHTCNAANAMYKLYASNPNVDPRFAAPK